MADVTLSSAVRSSLLSLQNTTDLIDRTQGRLSSGLKVASAIDDAVSFFQAKSLSDRASDFTEKKDSIDQGLSSLTAAVDGIEGIDNLVRQLKGIMQSLKSAEGSQFTDLIAQYNSLRTEIGTLADDTEYQGSNLVNNTTESVEVQFSNDTASILTIGAVNVRESGLGINQVAAADGQSFTYAADTNVLALGSAGDTITLTYRGSDQTVTTTTTISFTYGTVSITLAGNTQADVELSAGDTITVEMATAVAGTEFAAATNTLYGVHATTGDAFTVDASTTEYIREGETTDINSVITALDSALTTLRTETQSLGNNVALLQTRLDFTENYVNTLETGGAKLTLADINEEGANLLALQTRQQLGISALSFAGQAEQGILSLFR